MNGQLSLMMLYEMISLRIPGSIPLMQNTDGIEMIIPKEYKQTYLDICREWENITKLELEHGEYSKMVIADVNNYIAINKEKEVSKEDFLEIQNESPHYVFREENNKYFYQATKCKGRFDFVDIPLHKNKSFQIIPKAIYNYFIFNTLPEKTIQYNSNIFDYCAGIKAKGDWDFYGNSYTLGGVHQEKLQKINRYYISNRSGYYQIIKKNRVDGRVMEIHAGLDTEKLFNQVTTTDKKDLVVDNNFYLSKIYKEIENIEGPKTVQLTLF